MLKHRPIGDRGLIAFTEPDTREKQRVFGPHLLRHRVPATNVKVAHDSSVSIL